MKRFIEGEDRTQISLLPQCLDDYIADDNPIRAVEAFVEELDLRELGFDRAEPAVTGRLAPDFKTTADFRRDNGTGIRNVCRRFVQMCRQVKLFSQAIMAIDSSKFKAVNGRDRNFTPSKIDKRQRQIEDSIQRCLEALETADRTQPVEVEAKTTRLCDKIKALREQMRRMDRIREQLKQQPDEQLSLTDPDCRSIISQAKGTGVVGRPRAASARRTSSTSPRMINTSARPASGRPIDSRRWKTT